MTNGLHTCRAIGLTLLLLGIIPLKAQDTLYLKNGRKQIGFIAGMNEAQVKYRLDSVQSDHLYVMAKADIARIVTREGKEMRFKNQSPRLRRDPRKTDFGRNFISWNVYDLAVDPIITMGYERSSKSGDYSIKGVLSLGSLGIPGDTFAPDHGTYYNDNKIISSGLGLYYYPSGQGKCKPFFGPLIETGLIRTATKNDYKRYSGIYFESGVLFQALPCMNISVSLSFGITNAGPDSVEPNEDIARFGFSIGYKF